MVAKAKAKPEEDRLDADYVAAIDKAREDADAGRTVPYEQVRRWLQSWGRKKEVPRPKCK
jgi:predicted transcriptional regulator